MDEMSEDIIRLRLYTADDEEDVIQLWQRAWQKAMPGINFEKRFGDRRKYWKTKIVSKVPETMIIVAERRGAVIGFMIIDWETGYLVELVVSWQFWKSTVGELLLSEAKWLSPTGVDLNVDPNNDRAVRFFEKHKFVKTGDVKKGPDGPIQNMQWRPKNPKSNRLALSVSAKSNS
jgi:putative acetyltransferase